MRGEQSSQEEDEQRFFWGSPEHPRPYTATFHAATGTWERDR